MIKRKGVNFMLNGKTLIIVSIIGQIKKILHKISKYFSKPYDRFGGNKNRFRKATLSHTSNQ